MTHLRVGRCLDDLIPGAEGTGRLRGRQPFTLTRRRWQRQAMPSVAMAWRRGGVVCPASHASSHGSRRRWWYGSRGLTRGLILTPCLSACNSNRRLERQADARYMTCGKAYVAVRILLQG